MKINGVMLKYHGPVTLTDVLNEYGYNPNRVAVELNGHIVPRSEYDNTSVLDEDSMEIVRIVGGG